MKISGYCFLRKSLKFKVNKNLENVENSFILVKLRLA